MKAVAVGGHRRHAERGQRGGERPRVGEAEPADRRSPLGEVPVERLGEQRQRQVGLVLGRARLEHRAALGARGDVPEQPRLADPRLPLDQQHAARAGTEVGERGGDRLALGVRPIEVGTRTATA